MSYLDYSTNQDEDEKRHRVLLDQVFDEAHDVFKDDFTIKKCPPIQRSSNQSKLESTEPEHVSHRCSSGVESKAGKTFFPILVGHEEYLASHLRQADKLALLHILLTCIAIPEPKPYINWTAICLTGLTRL